MNFFHFIYKLVNSLWNEFPVVLNNFKYQIQLLDYFFQTMINTLYKN